MASPQDSGQDVVAGALEAIGLHVSDSEIGEVARQRAALLDLGSSLEEMISVDGSGELELREPWGLR